MKNKSLYPKILNSFRYLISALTFIGLVVPFIMQETLYPFFRFGMFAEPVKTSIQTEQFFLAAPQEDGSFNLQIYEKTDIRKSKLDYLLRNYYYRNESQQFLAQLAGLLPAHQVPDTLFILRVFQNDTSIVAHFP